MHVRSFDGNPAQDRDKKRGRDERDGEGDAGVVGKCVANVSWQMCVCVCVCVRVSVCLSVSVSVSVCLYACGVAQQRTIAGIARATAVCILCSLSLFQTRAHMHICSHTRSAPSNGMQMSKRKHN